MTLLLDANVLIALTITEHEFHERAVTWFTRTSEFATCPVVEGALVRFLIRVGETPATCGAVLVALHGHPRHVFWPDSISYADVALGPIRGHRQVTDTYLAALARHHGGRLATFDAALAAAHPDIADSVS